MDGRVPCREAESAAGHDNEKETKRNADRVLEVDWKLYEQLLKDTPLDDAQKQAFIEALWSILVCLWGAGYSSPSATVPEDER